MSTSIPSGLGSTLGYTAEATVGTFLTTSMRWPRFDNETFAFKKTVVESEGLHQGLYHEAARRSFVQKEAQGTVSMDLATTQLGLLFKHILGSSTIAQIGSSAAWTQIHVPGDTKGLALSIQAGRAQTNGTIQQFNYNGCKIVDATLSVQRGQQAKLDITVDSWSETTATAYAAASFVSSAVYDFSQCVIKTGGTASTSSGVTTVSAGAAPAGIINSLSIKWTNPLKVDRFNIGSQTKSEQLANAFRTIDVEFEIDFANLTDVYSAGFAADTSLVFQSTFTGAVIASTDHYKVDVILPALFINEDPVPVDSGPDVISQKVKAVALDDGSGSNPVCQLTYQSTDTAI